jgi:hypothetical protein
MLMVNWRLHAWIAKMTDISLAKTYELIPLWAVNVLAGVLCGFVLALVAVTVRQRDLSPSPAGRGEKRDYLSDS